MPEAVPVAAEKGMGQDKRAAYSPTRFRLQAAIIWLWPVRWWEGEGVAIRFHFRLRSSIQMETLRYPDLLP